MITERIKRLCALALAITMALCASGCMSLYRVNRLVARAAPAPTAMPEVLATGSPTPSPTPEPTPEPAVENGIEMKVSMGYDNTMYVSRWMPVIVNIKTETDIDGELAIVMPTSPQSGPIEYTVPVAMAAGSEKRYTIYVNPETVIKNTTLSLRKGSTILADLEIKMNVGNAPMGFLGILGDTSVKDTLTYVPDIAPVSQMDYEMQMKMGATIAEPYVDALKTVMLDEANFPSRIDAMQEFRAIVVNGFDLSSLSADSRETLEAYMQQGGILIVATGANGNQAIASVGQYAPNVKFEGTSVVDSKDAIEQSTQIVLRDGTMTAARLSGADSSFFYAGIAGAQSAADAPTATGTPTATGAPVATPASTAGQGATPAPTVRPYGINSGFTTGSTEVPLVYMKAYGNGQVYFMAFDFAQKPISAYKGAYSLLTRMVPIIATYKSAYNDPYSVERMLSAMNAMEIPSIWIMAAMLVAFLLLIWPVGYLVLKRMKRLELMWGLVPALALVFTAGIYLLGVATKGTDNLVNSVSTVNMQLDGSFKGSRYIGVFSSELGRLSVGTQDSATLTPIQSTSNYYDPQTGQEIVKQKPPRAICAPDGVIVPNVRPWTMSTYSGSVMGKVGQGFSADLALKDGVLTGKIKNDSGFRVTSALLSYLNAYIVLGDIEVGASVDVLRDFNSIATNPYGGDELYVALETLFPNMYGGGDLSNIETERLQARYNFMSNMLYMINDRGAQRNANMENNAYLIGFMEDIESNDIIVNGETIIPEGNEALVNLAISIPWDYQGKLNMMPGQLGFVSQSGAFAANATRGTTYIENTTAFTINLHKFFDEYNITSAKVHVPVYQPGANPQIHNILTGQWEAFRNGDEFSIEKLNTYLKESSIIEVRYEVSGQDSSQNTAPGMAQPSYSMEVSIPSITLEGVRK